MIRSLSLLSLLPILSPLCLAQRSDVVCLPYYRWTYNSQDKTPCEVASSLLALCNGGTFDVLPLSDGQHYQGPTMVANADACMCTTVTFSLMTACGLCQGRSVLRWSEWSANCPAVTFNQFSEPLPPDVRVPAWAYYDVRTTDTFDQFLARDNANATESTAVPGPSQAVDTATLTSLSPTSSPTIATAASAETGPKALPDIQYANLIGGSIVGSLFGIILIIVGVVFWVRLTRTPNALGSDAGVEKGPN